METLAQWVRKTRPSATLEGSFSQQIHLHDKQTFFDIYGRIPENTFPEPKGSSTHCINPGRDFVLYIYIYVSVCKVSLNRASGPESCKLNSNSADKVPLTKCHRNRTNILWAKSDDVPIQGDGGNYRCQVARSAVTGPPVAQLGPQHDAFSCQWLGIWNGQQPHSHPFQWLLHLSTFCHYIV